MSDFVPGVVMPVGPNRIDFARLAIESILQGDRKPESIVVVTDGFRIDKEFDSGEIEIIYHEIDKHRPGLEQPRNVGVRILRNHYPNTTHVWFVDSDVLMYKSALADYEEKYLSIYKTDIVMIGPYDWMPPGARFPMLDLKNDPRWAFFNDRSEGEIRFGMNSGLACFSGNLVWNIDEFIHIGGFWNEIHHGRCEDGELGIRAYADGIGFVPVPSARGWHMDHPRDVARIHEMNARDVPLLNARHPWVQQHGVFVAERDGKRLDQRCATCGEVVNTIDWWRHQDLHV